MKNSSRAKVISKSRWSYLLPRIEKLYSKSVAVLMGGIGSEREVSLNSGKAVYKALSEELNNVKLVEIRRESTPRLKRILKGVDIVFIALHGAYGEDGTLQGYLDRIGISYTGSGAKASQRAMQKDVSRKMFASADIPVAKGAFLPLKIGALKNAANRIGLPLVVKPADSGSSVGVSIVLSGDRLAAAFACAAKETNRGLVVEEYVKGTEITVGILDDDALPIIELRPAREFFDYKAKYSDPGTRYILPTKISAGLQKKAAQFALDAFRILGCSGFGRVDMIVGENGPVVLEVNTIPGFTSHSLVPKAAQHLGLDMTAISMLILALAGEK